MIPLRDNNPTTSLPLLTYALIAACIGAFLLQWSGGTEASLQASVQTFGFIPAHLFAGGSTLTTAYGAGGEQTAPWLTIFTSMFMHGGLAHIGGNLLYLWIFGDNIENTLGKVKFILFYLACGVAAALAQAAIDPSSTIPMVGASGAISGLLAGYMLLYPKQPITVFMPNVGLTQVPAIMMIGLWFIYQLILGVTSNPAEGGVAFFAHIGGFLAGCLLILPVLLTRPKKPQLWQ